MDACVLIRERLAELGLDQKRLAEAAGITESYVSQLLTRKKSPPAPERTDIYERMEELLKLPRGKLADLAEHQRINELRRSLGGPPKPLNKGVRDFVLRKCLPSSEPQIRAEFEKDALGALERLVMQKLLDVVKNVAKQELGSEEGVHLLARLSDLSFEETRVTILEFLDTDVLNLSAEQCESFLDPLVESWDIDLVRFGMDIVLNRRLGPGHLKRLEIVEAGSDGPVEDELGLQEFLRDRSLSGDATEDEIAFLKKLRFGAKRPLHSTTTESCRASGTHSTFASVVGETAGSETTWARDSHAERGAEVNEDLSISVKDQIVRILEPPRVLRRLVYLTPTPSTGVC